MGVRLIVAETAGADAVAIYDSVSGWAFGPVFDNREAAEAFLEWLPDDARSYSNTELSNMYGIYVDQRRVPA